MSKSIFECECERLQPSLLKKVSKLTKLEAKQMGLYAMDHFSFEYGSGYLAAYVDVFDMAGKDEEKSKLTFSEAIQNLKAYKKCDLFFDGYCGGIGKIYGRTYEEILNLYDEKDYWMAYGTKE